MLRLLYGYLTILGGSHVCHMTSSIEYLSRIIHAVAQVMLHITIIDSACYCVLVRRVGYSICSGY